MEKIILGIETSCDDSCIGIIRAAYIEESMSWQDLANIRVTQKYDKGVIPEIAARLHLDALNNCLKEALTTSGLTIEDIDIICATATPGLVGSLFVGYNFGLALASANNKVFIPVHHIEGHMLVCFNNTKIEPFIAIIASGGHSQIVVYNHNKYEIVCTSQDDAIGEVFDKIGRELSCSFPAGPEIEQLALQATNRNIQLTLPCKNKLNWSFSGVKTQCIKLIQEGHSKYDVAYTLQKTVCDSIVEKLNLVKAIYEIDNIIFCGGVSVNQYLRTILGDYNVKYALMKYCTDNGIMIAVAGFKHYFTSSNKVNRYLDIGTYIGIEDWNNI
jgi:N6-L-threonylcarbamoyladenine synthase